MKLIPFTTLNCLIDLSSRMMWVEYFAIPAFSIDPRLFSSHFETIWLYTVFGYSIEKMFIWIPKTQKRFSFINWDYSILFQDEYNFIFVLNTVII